MRLSSASAVLALGLLVVGCDDKGPTPTTPTTTAGAPKADSPIVTQLVSAQAQLEAAKAEVAKYEAQIADYTKQLGDLNGKLAVAEKALADSKAKFQAQVAPLQQKLDELNKRIKTLEAVKVGNAGPRRAYRLVHAGFDVGGLINKGSETLASLKTEADKYQKQIDGLLAQADAAGLPFTKEIAGYTSQIKSVTEQLTSAQGLLASAQSQLASLTGE